MLVMSNNEHTLQATSSSKGSSKSQKATALLLSSNYGSVYVVYTKHSGKSDRSHLCFLWQLQSLITWHKIFFWDVSSKITLSCLEHFRTIYLICHNRIKISADDRKIAAVMFGPILEVESVWKRLWSCNLKWKSTY